MCGRTVGVSCYEWLGTTPREQEEGRAISRERESINQLAALVDVCCVLSYIVVLNVIAFYGYFLVFVV